MSTIVHLTMQPLNQKPKHPAVECAILARDAQLLNLGFAAGFASPMYRYGASEHGIAIVIDWLLSEAQIEEARDELTANSFEVHDIRFEGGSTVFVCSASPISGLLTQSATRSTEKTAAGLFQISQPPATDSPGGAET